jgi:hypothetical protein
MTSPVVRIAADVWRGAADTLLYYMRQQRSGWNPLFRDSVHTHDGIVVDEASRAGQRVQVSGGWADASDYLQYVATSATATYMMLAAYRDLGLAESPECQRGVTYLHSVQNDDGGWGGDRDCPSSVEETALAVEVLVDLAPGEAVERGLLWLIEAVESGRFREPSPIGFYFAKLWYYEKLYPLIFTVAALGRASRKRD